jgi:RNA recognition motif-containing protein
MKIFCFFNSLGFMFVHYDNKEDAFKAVKEFNNFNLGGWRIRVAHSFTREQKETVSFNLYFFYSSYFFLFLYIFSDYL